MSFAPSEVILGATLPLENGSTITVSVAGHIETERDIDDAVVIFGRKLLKYTNCATDEDRLTVRQIISSITSTPLDKVPDVGAATPAPAPKKEPWAPKITKSSYDAMQTAKQDTVPATPPSAEEQATAAVARVVKPPAPAETPAAEDVCERCGCSVPKSQAGLSKLFMSKTLCKKCMEAP